MQGLTTAQLLDLVEAGDSRSWAARGLLLLGCAWPESTSEQRAALPCGERDRALIFLRIATFGRQTQMYTTCADCSGQLEAEFDLSTLVDGERPDGAGVAPIEVGDRTLTVRPLSSGDFLAVEGSPPEEAGRELVRRTLSHCDEPPPHVDAELRSQVAAAIQEADPLSKIELAFECHDCGRGWNETLDIVDLFWKEIESAARRVAWQVHALAHAYGWTEKTILDLTPARRNLYLSMVAHG
jgi:hypothetical protein